MSGHLRRRGKSSFELKYDIPRDEGGGRRIAYRSFKGTRKEAAAELARLLTQAADGIEPSKITVGAYVAQRIEQWAASGRISPKTAERYGVLLARQILPLIGPRPLQKVTPADVERWHTALRGKISARTIGHAHKLLGKALRDAVRLGVLPRNVVAVQPPPKVVVEEMLILTPEQVAALPTVLDGHGLAPIATVALFTGMRAGELLALKWGNTDLDAKVIRVRQSLEQTKAGLRLKPPKSKSGVRDISLPDIVVDTLRQQRRQLLERRLLLGQGRLTDEDLVFPTWDGKPQKPNTFSSTWAKVAKAHELGISFHALRHTHASQLIAAGVDVVTIAKRLGHASADITLRVYAHLYHQDDSKAAAAINASLA